MYSKIILIFCPPTHKTHPGLIMKLGNLSCEGRASPIIKEDSWLEFREIRIRDRR